MFFQRLKHRLAYSLYRLFRFTYRDRFISLNKLHWLRQLFGDKENALAPPISALKSTGEKLSDQFLTTVLINDELGLWALDAETINFLEKEIKIRRPTTILEFGCGVSTICFAHFMRELHQDDLLRVFSIEQDDHYAKQVEIRLDTLQLNNIAKIIHAPLQKQVLEGVEVVCYQLPSDIESILNRRPDFVVIDGPSGSGGMRFGTLPLIKDYVSEKSVFFLDDALRDQELRIAESWSKLSYIKVFGMHLSGKGLLYGCISTNTT